MLPSSLLVWIHYNKSKAFEGEKSKLVKIDFSHKRADLFFAGSQALEGFMQGERVYNGAYVLCASVHQAFQHSLVLEQFEEHSLLGSEKDGVFEAVVEPVVLITAELELSQRQVVLIFESVHVHLLVPAQNFNQLSKVLRDHGQQEGVELLAMLEVVHQKVDELAHLDLLLITSS